MGPSTPLRLASWKRLLLATASTNLFAISASADGSSDASIYSLDHVPDWQASSAIMVTVSAPGADIVPVRYTVAPLTNLLGLNRTQETWGSVNLNGELVRVTETNYANITGANQIAYLSCDNTSSSFIDADRMFGTLMDNFPEAIVLYSEEGNSCGLSGSNLAYQNILTMVDSGDAVQMLNITNSGAVVEAQISGNVTSNANNQNAQGGNNSAIAMSILYSITGLITLLFLLIIATGALRAHRYPERYGPRSGYGGRSRQSRAKGLARAVLETLPIVKFGDQAPAKPDPSMELENTTDGRVNTIGRNPNEVQVHHLSTIPEDAEAHSKAPDMPQVSRGVTGAAADASETQSSIGAAVKAPDSRGSSTTDSDENLGCSICTEDFTVGEDVRVLPCDHKFHPHCVDPWLVNVSGTCPLCRLDLRPSEGDSDTISVDGQSEMPPPLEAENSAATGPTEAQPANQRRPARLFDLRRLHHASVEERIEALRRYRAESQTIRSNGDEDHSRLTKRLRDKFRIRTRAQSPSSSGRN